ncbi:MAG: class I SAM-dependent methyltransferase [Chlamydiota bacterium]
MSTLSDQHFWETIEKTPSPFKGKEDRPINLGVKTFQNLSYLQQEMVLSCTKISGYVKKYLISSSFKGTVLDLGCGIGPNAIPLVVKGCAVIVIDKQQFAINKYKIREINSLLTYEQGFNRATTIVGDITEIAYPTSVDAVICVDVLPYLYPGQLRTTMQKIFQSLCPGGKFIGTLFFKPTETNTLITIGMQKMGAHFYLGKALAYAIITRSGFQIKQAREQIEGQGQYQLHALEFIAEKPMASPSSPLVVTSSGQASPY